MTFSMLRFSTFSILAPNISKYAPNTLQPFIHFPELRKRNGSLRCRAAARQQKSGAPPSPKKKKKPSSKSAGNHLIGDDFVIEKSGGSGAGVDVLDELPAEPYEPPYAALPLPKPPAGFVLDEHGKVLMASDRRLATIVDSSNNTPLECVIRRVFRNSRGDECMLLCPVDTPIHVMKSVNVEGWTAVNDDKVDGLLPTVAYTLAKIHMHFIDSGFCYTARGSFCYTEADIFEIHMDTGEIVEGVPTEGIEIACFHMDGSHYMIYTPSDPLLFVAVKDKNGVLRIADDELMDDPTIISAIDEETEFNALVEEEAALLDSLLGR